MCDALRMVDGCKDTCRFKVIFRIIFLWRLQLTRINILQVMVLGSKGVGKTSVIEWLFNPQKFSSHNLEVYVPPPTHGIVRRWAEVDVQRNNFKNFHVCCYDFGGVSGYPFPV